MLECNNYYAVSMVTVPHNYVHPCISHMFAMADTVCVVCDARILDSRERRVCLIREPDTCYHIWTSWQDCWTETMMILFAMPVLNSCSTHTFVWRCFMACEKGLMHERKLVDICETISSSQRSPVKPKRPKSSSECDKFE